MTLQFWHRILIKTNLFSWSHTSTRMPSVSGRCCSLYNEWHGDLYGIIASPIMSPERQVMTQIRPKFVYLKEKNLKSTLREQSFFQHKIQISKQHRKKYHISKIFPYHNITQFSQHHPLPARNAYFCPLRYVNRFSARIDFWLTAFGFVEHFNPWSAEFFYINHEDQRVFFTLKSS